jgi:DNA polymerase-3 subunit gamma/tau
MLAFRPLQSDSPGSTGGGSSTVVKKKPQRQARADATRPPSVSAGAVWKDPVWSDLIGKLDLSGATKMLASNCAFLERRTNTVFLCVDPRSESMLTRQRKDTLSAALSAYYSEALSVDISVGESVVETPTQEESRAADERLEAAKTALESDPNVQALKEMFGAELNTDSIELINPSQTK